jgi:PadR family transcriptional regulator PadR
MARVGRGPPRRYYRITEDGRQVLERFVADWTRFRDAVDALMPSRPQHEVGGDGP